ncbi:unnamed protein product [Urochloa decumbens]|uniref:Uncharacterized protein n=1 Tax=Urochloa decumbens TaxID=240449 RepID=A0ABC9F3M0_9POAL
MSCRGTSAIMNLLALVLLIVSLLTPQAPIACARHVVVLNPNTGLNNRGDDKSLAKVLFSASTDDVAANKGYSGRKLGAPNKQEGNKATMGATTASAGSRPRMVKMRAAGKEQGDAAAEMYEMLRRDYAWKASRRRPINNGASRFQVKKP